MTYAHAGNSWMAFKRLLEGMGNEVVPPAEPNARTLSLGVSLAPEFACLPLKITLGSYVDAIQRGADTIVATGGVGPCRAGYYTTLQKQILRNSGFDAEIITFEPLSCGIGRFIQNIRMLNGDRLSLLAMASLIRHCWEQIKAFDDLERALHFVRPREVRRGEAEGVYRKAAGQVGEAGTLRCIREAKSEGLAALRAVEQDPDADPVRVGIVGEIYVVIEPAANLNMERILGDLGAEVKRSIFLTGWTMDNAVHEGGGRDIKAAAARYLPEMVGGHGQDSIGHTVVYAGENIDGVVQLAPFTCIPEIVAKAILPRVSEDLDIPVISFFLDEQTGEAGVRTRLEAFVDLLKRKRDARRRQGLEPVRVHRGVA
ncbi:MAG: CoA protein activase [Bacillota bacterium]